MAKLVKIVLVLALCALLSGPTTAISRWFSSSFEDLKFTMRRYAQCWSVLTPLKDVNMTETDYLVHQMRTFLETANYEPEQLANLSSLMDQICSYEPSYNYAISVYIDVNLYNNTADGQGKANRCRALDEALDAMYSVFKRAALNKTEPLDFSTIHFYPNASDKSMWYGLADLINTIWIKSETTLDHTCNITNAVKDFVAQRYSIVTPTGSNATGLFQDRASTQQASSGGGVLDSILSFVDRILDRVFGLQRRLYWESNSRLEVTYTRIGNGLGYVRDTLSSGARKTRDRITGLFSFSNSTKPANTHLNESSRPLNESRNSWRPIPHTLTTLAPSANSSNLAQVV